MGWTSCFSGCRVHQWRRPLVPPHPLLPILGVLSRTASEVGHQVAGPGCYTPTAGVEFAHFTIYVPLVSLHWWGYSVPSWAWHITDTQQIICPVNDTGTQKVCPDAKG